MFLIGGVLKTMDAKQMVWKEEEHRYFPAHDYRPIKWIVHSTWELLQRCWEDDDMDVETCNEFIAHELSCRALTFCYVAHALRLTSVSIVNPLRIGFFARLSQLKEQFLTGIGIQEQWNPLKDYSATMKGQKLIVDHFTNANEKLSNFASLFAESNFQWHVNPTLPLTVAYESNKALWPNTIAPTIYDYRNVSSLTTITLYCLAKLGKKTSHYTCKRFWKRLKKQHLTFTQIAYLMSLYENAIDLYPELLCILGYRFQYPFEWHPAHDDSAIEKNARHIYTRFAKLVSLCDIKQVFSNKLMVNPTLPLRVALHDLEYRLATKANNM